MVSVTTRKKGSRTYHYLIHKTGTKQYEKYLGRSLPEDMERLKDEFDIEILEREKIPLLERIQRNHAARTAKADRKIVQSEQHGFKIKHTYSTQRIEGSTMTYGQTRKLLEYNLSPKDTATEHIIEAIQIEDIFDDLLQTKSDVTKELILGWHERLFEKTDANNAGSFRRADVGPAGGRGEYSLWPDVIPDTEDLLEWYAENQEWNPVMLSGVFHRRFESIHPFIDGNGRIGRLLMLLILHRNGYPLMNILPRERLTYIKKLEASGARNGDAVFLKWFVSKYLRDNRGYL